MYVCAQLSLPLCNPIRLLSMGLSKQEYWNALPFPSPGDLPNPGIEPASLVSPAGSLPQAPPRKSPNLSRVPSKIP